MREELIIIKQNKIYQLGLLLGSLLFIVLGFYILSTAIGFNLKTTIFKVVSILSICFFGLALVLSTINLIKNKPGLELSSNGILNNSTAFNSYLIEWNNIKSINLKQISNQQFIIIELKEIQKIYSQVNFLTKILLKLNARMYSSSVTISSVTMKENTAELMQKITTYQKQSKQLHNETA